METLKIKEIIESKSFKDAILRGVKSGESTDWGFDGEEEFEYDTFDVVHSTDEIMTILKEYFLGGNKTD